MNRPRLSRAGLVLATALTTAIATAAVVTPFASANVAPPAAAPADFVPIVPCRLADTRPGGDNVGPRTSPLGANETVTFAVRGQNGQCTIPAGATAIASNVTAVGATAASFVTLFPADAPQRPLSSNLNTAPGAPPTPNQVTVALSANGAVSAYNRFGAVNLIIDAVGYFVPDTGAGQANVFNVTIPRGTTVIGQASWQLPGAFASAIVELPGVAPVPLTDDTIRFASGSTGQNDPTCTGTPEAPTAPAGKLCIYLGFTKAATGLLASPATIADRGFEVFWSAVGGGDSSVTISWAYTAP
ncbi:MAG TPA: hypothetical protein VNQ73_06410 [Ilumatobacter sp.]|nr:hypothetical protein [Ilumatobacter sp.]